ncbi:CAP domain-containing protein [Sphingomonas quercus]|uniref:SCP-like extracellular n=1 Tax=Sphingomonas quercus TaxID=2842451 RepID=A0ABS6BE11_9SPHN|nr:CAP domain-containing protein [Sphingomonas quercus]MBU3076548.1 SCP-like extracellular [Sphingomonas quercus]
MKAGQGPVVRRIVSVLFLIVGSAACLSMTAQDPSGRVNERLLAAHNGERGRVGVPPLRWNARLAAEAARYAAELVAQPVPVLRHDVLMESPDNIEGENIWLGTRAAYSPEDMVGLWLGERRAFRNGLFPNVSATGNYMDVAHYTQVVWRSTREVGCAIGTGEDYEVLVCRYLEGGNVTGERSF